jgi:hypothetical protein
MIFIFYLVLYTKKKKKIKKGENINKIDEVLKMTTKSDCKALVVFLFEF